MFNCFLTAIVFASSQHFPYAHRGEGYFCVCENKLIIVLLKIVILEQCGKGKIVTDYQLFSELMPKT